MEVSGAKPSARTRAEPHNFLSLKLPNKNSNAELWETQKDHHLLPRKGNSWQWKKHQASFFHHNNLETVYRYCRDSQLVRPAFHQNNPNILVKIETDSSMSPVNVLEGNFGLTRPLINWPKLSLESLQVAATRSDLFVLRPVQLLPRWLAGSLKLEHRTRHQMHEKGASGKMMDNVSCKINEIVLNMLCLWVFDGIQLKEPWHCLSLFCRHESGTPKSTVSWTDVVMSRV